ncbi:MAG: hypothetical protein FWD52_03465 [Candidatus Bathyarchaeota archaeon]|nr:hypothetical protein [Candidatus Termiticorpusculum sp.]
MKELVTKNKEIRGQIKLLKTECFVIENVCFKMLEFFTAEQKNSIIKDAKNVLIQDIDESKVKEYLLKNTHHISYSITSLKDVVVQSLGEK